MAGPVIRVQCVIEARPDGVGVCRLVHWRRDIPRVREGALAPMVWPLAVVPRVEGKGRT